MVRNDEGFCRRCGKMAQCVDHIIPIAEGGTDDRHNLQALCNQCHSKKTRREQMRYAEKNNPPEGMPSQKIGGGVPIVYLVCGPPGSGKTTYCLEHMREGDVVVDMDAIAQALMGNGGGWRSDAVLHIALAMKEQAIQSIPTSGVPCAWVIDMGARREDREGMAASLNAEIIILDVEASTCMERIKNDPPRKNMPRDWGPLVEKWWMDYDATRQ